MGRKKTIENDDLLAVARKAFVENGFRVPTAEIARRAGISEGVIFQRYATKDEFFFAAMAPPPMDVDTLFRTERTKPDPCENLEDIALGILGFFREIMPTLVHLVTHPSFKPEILYQHSVPLLELRLMSSLTDYLERERAEGRIEANDLRSTAGLLIASLHSLALLELMGSHGGHMEEGGVRAMVRSLWNGLEPRRKPSPSSGTD